MEGKKATTALSDPPGGSVASFVSALPSAIAAAISRFGEAMRMSWMDAANPWWTWLLFAGALANIAALWSDRYLPFTDLPQHAAAIATIRHWGDPAWKAQEYFTLALGRSQYLLYYLAGALLAFPLGTAERANLVLLSLTALAFPFALRSLLRAMRMDGRLALFANGLFWSQSLLIGFFNYVAALPLLLWALALAVREAEEPRPRRTALLAAASVALFYLHLSAFLLFAPAAGLAQVVLGPLEPAPLLRRLVWAVPTVALGVVFLLASPVVRDRRFDELARQRYLPSTTESTVFPQFVRWICHERAGFSASGCVCALTSSRIPAVRSGIVEPRPTCCTPGMDASCWRMR